MKKIRLLIVEDNRLLLDGILKVLKPYKDIVIITSSAYVNQLLLKNQKLHPDVVLLDIDMRSQNSLPVIETIKTEFPQAKTIVMNLTVEQADILLYVKAGVRGFILKDASHKEFLNTIRTVAHGSTVLPPLLVDSLFSKIVEHAIEEGKPKFKEAGKMTKRETEVIALLSDGMSNKEIAQKTNISTYTVKSHIHNIMEKLALHTRLEIANYFYSCETLGAITKNISLINN
ncbi:MAG: response regulator transcription factor [Bacteroidota bacterium]